MIKFEKVSLEQFKKDMLKNFPQLTDDQIEEYYNNIQLPTRGSKYSAGYDLYSTIEFNVFGDNGIIPNFFGTPKPITIPLGIKAQIPEDMFLAIVPRSGNGFKTGVSLANTVGIIDSDYYNNSNNEGHIILKFVPGFDTLEAKRGDRIAQGIFMKYYTVDDDKTTEVRTGGFGSTSIN